jgi:U3 small nucleolar RNA-associated protein MPP10
MAMETISEESGPEALQRLRATDPPVWLAPSPALSQMARAASEHLFASLRPFTPKTPFDKLLTKGFDAEQVWQQIDLQAHPLLSTLRRDVKRFEKNPKEISKLKKVLEVEKKEPEGGRSVVEEESEDFDGFDEELDEDEEEEEEEEEGERESEGGEEEEEGAGGGIEDGFLKIKELEEFLEEDEAREYGLKKKDKKEVKKVDGLGLNDDDDEGEYEDEDEEDEDEDGDEVGLFFRQISNSLIGSFCFLF